MGIRMLHRRTAQIRAQAQSDTATTPATPLPAFAADASTARIPARTGLRRFTAGISVPAGRGRMARRCRDYLARLVTRLPRPRLTSATRRAPRAGRPCQ